MVSYHGKERAGEGGREEGKGASFTFPGKRDGEKRKGEFSRALSPPPLPPFPPTDSPPARRVAIPSRGKEEEEEEEEDPSRNIT